MLQNRALPVTDPCGFSPGRAATPCLAPECPSLTVALTFAVVRE